MRIYIATRFANREAARELKRKLISQGHEITASWIDDEPDSMLRRDIAVQDLIDVKHADALIAITEKCDLSPGGMHFEAGYAFALGKKVFKIGPAVHVFYEHPEIKDWAEVQYA